MKREIDWSNLDQIKKSVERDLRIRDHSKFEQKLREEEGYSDSQVKEWMEGYFEAMAEVLGTTFHRLYKRYEAQRDQGVKRGIKEPRKPTEASE